MTKKKEEFVEAYLSDVKRNKTAAAIKAGYSEKTARQKAYNLMKDPEIAAAIAEREKELHEQNTAKANEVIEILTSIARGEEVENIPLFVGDGKQEFSEGKPSARDKIKALELLGKHYGLFDGNSNDDNNTCGGVIIIPEVNSDSEVQASNG